MKAYLNKVKIHNIGDKLEEPLLPFSVSFLLKTKTGCRIMHDSMVKSSLQPKSVTKWLNELGGKSRDILNYLCLSKYIFAVVPK